MPRQPCHPASRRARRHRRFAVQKPVHERAMAVAANRAAQLILYQDARLHGQSQDAALNHAGLSYPTKHRYIRAFRESGLDGLKPRTFRCGRKPGPGSAQRKAATQKALKLPARLLWRLELSLRMGRNAQPVGRIKEAKLKWTK